MSYAESATNYHTVIQIGCQQKLKEPFSGQVSNFNMELQGVKLRLRSRVTCKVPKLQQDLKNCCCFFLYIGMKPSAL